MKASYVSIVVLLTCCRSLPGSLAGETCGSHRQPSLKTILSEDSATVCEECEYYSAAAKKEILSEHFEGTFHKVVNILCDVIPISKQCKNTMEKLYDVLVEYVKTMDPNQFCQTIRLCPKHESCGISEPHMTCESCTDAVKKATEVLQFDVVARMVKVSLKEACKTFQDKNEQKKCNELAEIFNTALPHIVRSVNHEAICQQLHQCPVTHYQQMFHTDTRACAICTKTVEQLRSLVHSPSFIQHARAIIKAACALTIVYNDQCTKYFDGHLGDLIDHLWEMDSKELCTKMGICH